MAIHLNKFESHLHNANRVYFLYVAIISPERKSNPLKKLESPSPKDAGSGKKIFKVDNVLLSPLRKGYGLHLNKPNFPLPMNALCQV